MEQYELFIKVYPSRDFYPPNNEPVLTNAGWCYCSQKSWCYDSTNEHAAVEWWLNSLPQDHPSVQAISDMESATQPTSNLPEIEKEIRLTSEYELAGYLDKKSQPPSAPAVNWDQVKINFDAGMPELEASFQAGYSAGVEFEQKRKASAPAIEETKNEIWRNSILNLQGREKEFYDMLRYCLNDEELALGYCSSFESIAKKYDTSATQVAVWAKASDRLPEPFKVVPCKYTPDSPDPRKDTELHWGFVSKEGNWDRGWKHHQVEWLDESPPSSKESDAVEFLEWMWQNRWFDRDDKYWYYTFEQGTYISKKAYNKDYRKTTKELYKIFKQSKINNEKEKD